MKYEMKYERNKRIYAWHKGGHSLSSLARQYQLTRERVRQIIWGIDNPTPKSDKKRYLKYAHLLNLNHQEMGSYPQLRTLSGRDFLRELVRIRDNFTCWKCGRKWKENERRFDVHHENHLEGEQGRKYQNNLDFENMKTYCHKCHLGLDCVTLKMSFGKKAAVENSSITAEKPLK